MKKQQQKYRGSALAYALVILSVSMIVLVSMLGYITTQFKFSLNRVEKQKAFQVAEAGVYYYRWYLAHETSGKTAQQMNTFLTTGGPLGFNIQSDYEGIGKYEIEVTPPDSSSTIIMVQSTGWSYKNPDMKRTVQVRFRRPSWSEYMFLTNDFINFGDWATVYGKVHSNGGIRFDGVAYNVVSSLVPRFDDPTHGGGQEFGVHTHDAPADPTAPAYPWPGGTVPERPDVFKAGREFPVPEISFNGVISDLANMKAQAIAGSGKYFNNAGKGRRIILKTNGTYDICTVDAYHNTALYITRYLKTSGSGTCTTCSGSCLSNFPIPNEGIIFVEDNAWVEGTVNNKNVTIVAANLIGGTQADIYIGNSNIRYSAYDCANIIGLVAQRDVTLIRDCPDNFIIDAALLAQSGRVSRGDHGFSSKESLTFNGAIVSYLEPYFNHGNSGFGIRTYNFDNNLLYCPPPYFPTGTEYAIDLWEEL